MAVPAGTILIEEATVEPHISGQVVRISEHMSKCKKPADMIRWAAYRLRAKAEKIGTFDAPNDPVSARTIAWDKFDVKESERWRISVQRE